MGSEKLKKFMEELDRRYIKQGWVTTILTINQIYFLRNYGMFTYAMVLAHVCTYAFRSGREEQDGLSLQNCLEETLTTSALDTLNAERSKYTLTLAQENATLGPQKKFRETLTQNTKTDYCSYGVFSIVRHRKLMQPLQTLFGN
jgi:hypothetical protein